VGVTCDLLKRAREHKNSVVKGFTEKFGLKKLIWYERHETMESAIQREKAIKAWRRYRKLKTVEEMNPDWRDLYEDLM
jgi:putative endonuclease